MQSLSNQLKVIDNDTRRSILSFLWELNRDRGSIDVADQFCHGMSISELAEEFAISQPAMSRHIDLLRQAGFLAIERSGTVTRCYHNAWAIKRFHDALGVALHVAQDSDADRAGLPQPTRESPSVE